MNEKVEQEEVEQVQVAFDFPEPIYQAVVVLHKLKAKDEDLTLDDTFRYLIALGLVAETKKQMERLTDLWDTLTSETRL